MDEHAESNNQLHYEELYRNLIQEMELMHKDNLVKLRVGFRSLLIVPTIFLILLFFTGSSKTIFLILWIVSMVTGLGNLYYLGVQCYHPLLYLLALFVADFCITFINYCLVYAFGAAGLAISVIMPRSNQCSTGR